MVKTIDHVELSGKKVFVRVDFNVPIDADGSITDETRIIAALPTIRKLQESGAKIILASHLGRPKGKRVDSMSLSPVAPVLADKLSCPVMFLNDCIGEGIQNAVNQLKNGQVALLENLRFHSGETENDPVFSSELASLADVYVNDAFGTAHRAHASTFGVAELLPHRLSGYLIKKELVFPLSPIEPRREDRLITNGFLLRFKHDRLCRITRKAPSKLTSKTCLKESV